VVLGFSLSEGGIRNIITAFRQRRSQKSIRAERRHAASMKTASVFVALGRVHETQKRDARAKDQRDPEDD